MAILELVSPKPEWEDALEVALVRPPGIPERREEPREPDDDGQEQGRRVADDLVWLRQAVDEPDVHGLKELRGTAAVGLWKAGDGDALTTRLCRLRDRGVLYAAGFLLHEQSDN